MPVYRVCIADDELYVRKSITQRIEKSKLPLLVVGTAENGEKGWELFNKEAGYFPCGYKNAHAGWIGHD